MMDKNTQQASEPSGSEVKKQITLSYVLNKYGVLIVFVLMFIVLSLSTKTFFTPKNLINVVRQVSVNGIIAVGMMFVLLTGGIDLSVGSVVALSGVVAANFAQSGAYPVIVPVLMGALTGVLVGIVNGFLIVKMKIVPFIATMGMLSIAKGAALVYSNGRPISNLADNFRFIGGGTLLGFIPVLSLFMISCFLVGFVVLGKTRFGRYVYAIGGNEKAARVSGLNVDICKYAVYLISAVFASLAGVVLAARINAGSPASGDGYELDAIAAVVIGGTSLNGGIGTIVGTLLGVLIVGILNNGLDLLNVSSYFQLITKGVIIILAVMLDTRSKKRL